MLYIFLLTPLLAEGDGLNAGWLAVIIPVTAAITGGILKLFDLWQKWRVTKRDDEDRNLQRNREGEDRTIEGQDRLIQRLDNERKAQDERLDRLSSQLSNSRIMNARMIVWIRHLEELLANKGEKFQKWDEIIKDTANLSVGDSGEFEDISKAIRVPP
jgi:hypothetical protein